MDKKKRNTIIAVAAVVVVAALLVGLYFGFGKRTDAGTKHITVKVVLADKKSESFSITTDEEYLGAALQDEALVEGEQGEYGLYIKSVNGVKADESNSEWWKLTKGGEAVMTGADMTPIADGDTFELTLTVGYDSF